MKLFPQVLGLQTYFGIIIHRLRITATVNSVRIQPGSELPQGLHLMLEVQWHDVGGGLELHADHSALTTMPGSRAVVDWI